MLLWEPMLDTISEDLIASICENMDIRSIANLMSVTINMVATARADRIYQHVALVWWGQEFWKRAFCRLTYQERLPTYKDELVCMEKFQGVLDQRWTANEFYRIWSAEENWFIRSKRIRLNVLG